MFDNARKAIVSCGVALVMGGCAGVGAAQGLFFIPGDAREDCAQQCQELNMELGSMVLMAKEIGCVCNPERRAAHTPEAPAGAAAGAAAAMLLNRAQEQPQRKFQQ